MSVKRDFSRKLPEPINGLRTLADIRDHILELSEPSEHWLYVGELVLQAAESGDTKQVGIALRMFKWH